ncbi:MAG: tripartite tricarboxylate transporter substrate binding protein [Verrucomicrobia bacterium]|nr:tripartite tricarboxylate transporter substrate binding protein [Verrucomicrobiota bacterium]
MTGRDRASVVIVVALLALLGAMRWQRGGGEGAYPQRGLTLICPYAPGGGTDLFCRGLARALEPRLGRTVTVTNQTGGGGAVGFSAGLMARPDGHTLTAVTFELVSLPPQGLVPFTHADFDLLLRVNMDPSAVAVRADFPAKTLDEFLAVARARGGRLSIGTSGPASPWHLAAVRLGEVGRFEARLVPYAGAAPAVTALVGGHVDAVTVGPGEVQSQVKSGQLKLLAVLHPERLAAWPEVPTTRELGYDVQFGTWRGIAVPRGLPAATREKLRAALREAVASPEFVQFAVSAGLNLAVADAPEFAAVVEAQAREVATMMQRLGVGR